MSPPKICRLNYSAQSARDSMYSVYYKCAAAILMTFLIALHSGAAFEGQNVTINGNYCDIEY